MAYLTDMEKRLLFSALTKEKKLCEEIDKEKMYDGVCSGLVPIVEKLESKFYYDKFEQDIYEQAYKDGYNKAIDEFAEQLRLDCLDSCYHEVRMFRILKLKDEFKKNLENN